MPKVKVQPRFYSTTDIMVMLGVGRTKATEIMHMFEQRGQILRDGKMMRVAIPVFEQWVNEHIVPVK